MIRLHLLSSTAEVSLCRMAFFFSLFLFSLDYPEGAGRLRREGREVNPKEVHIVKRNNPGTELEILNDILALKRVFGILSRSSEGLHVVSQASCY